MSDELEIIGRAQRGERQALEDLLIAHQSACYGFALRLTRNAADAEDVCQDAFVRAARDIAAWKHSGSFRSWLLKIVLNAHQNRRQADSARQQRERRYGMSQETQTHGDHAEKSDLKEQLELALKALDDSFRLPISLHYEQGLTRAEVAEVLNIPEGTAATHIRRGVERLRELLTNAGYASAETAVIAALSGSTVTVPSGMAATIHGIVAGTASKGAVATGAAAAGKIKLAAAVFGAAVIAAVLVVAAPKFNATPAVPSQPSPIAAAGGPVVETKDEPKPEASTLPYPISSISGVVLEDKSQKPVPGITILARSNGGEMMQPIPGDRIIDNLPSAVTDEQGRYFIRFMTNARTRLDSVNVWAKTSKYTTAGVSNFGIYQGEAVSAAPMILRTFTSARGRIVDPDGKPVAGALVRCFGHSEMTTDKDGYFTDTKVTDPQVTWDIAAQGFELKRFPFVIGSPEPVIKLTPCKPITGTVVEADGSPAKDVQVYAGTWPSLGFFPNWSVPVDEKGRFIMGTVAENGGSIYVFPVRNKLIAGEPVKVDAGQTDVALRVYATGQIDVEVKDTDGKPLRMANIRSTQKNDQNSRFMRVGRTDDNGRVVLMDVPAGPTQVSLSYFRQFESRAGTVVLPSTEVNVEAGKKVSAGTLACQIKLDGLSMKGYLLDEKNQPVLHAMFYVAMKRAEPNVQGGLSEMYRGGGWTEVDGRFEFSFRREEGFREGKARFEAPMPEKAEKVHICVRLNEYEGWAFDQTLDWPKDVNHLDVKNLVVKLVPERIITVKSERPNSKLEWTTVNGCTDEAGKPLAFRLVDPYSKQETQRVAVRHEGVLKLSVFDGLGHSIVVPVAATGDAPVIAKFPATRTIELSIMDDSGRPVEGVSFQGRETKREWPFPVKWSNKQGVISFDVATEAEGRFVLFKDLLFEPYIGEIKAGDSPIRQSIKLKRADATLSGRISGVGGKAVAQAKAWLDVSIDTFLSTSFDLHADKDGQFTATIPAGMEVRVRGEADTRDGWLEGMGEKIKVTNGQKLNLNITLDPRRRPWDPQPTTPQRVVRTVDDEF